MKEQPGPDRCANDFDPIADVYDQLVSWAPYGQWVRGLIARLRAHGLQEGALVLDIACGTALSTIPWAEEGFRVVGVDRSEVMLAQARKKLHGRRRGVRFVRQDYLALDLGELFDVAVCMHSGLDYLLEARDLSRAICSVRRQLRPGGLFAFDKCLDVPEFYHDEYSDTRRIPAGTATFRYVWRREEKLFEQHCTVLREGPGGAVRRTEVVHYMRATPPGELVRMAQKAGLEVLEPPRQFTVSDPGMGIFRAV